MYTLQTVHLLKQVRNVFFFFKCESHFVNKEKIPKDKDSLTQSAKDIPHS